MATLQYAPISATIIGDNIIVTGDPSIPNIQVLCVQYQCSAGTTLTIKNDTTSLTGDMVFNSSGGLFLPFDPNGNLYFACDSGNNFIFTLAGASAQVSGFLMYYQF